VVEAAGARRELCSEWQSERQRLIQRIPETQQKGCGCPRLSEGASQSSKADPRPRIVELCMDDCMKMHAAEQSQPSGECATSVKSRRKVLVSARLVAPVA